MTAYYNEIDPAAAQWLRNLIAAGLIAPGDVDERSIEDVPPDDLRGYTQCHFFAGIGVWSYALRRAGWPDDRPIWTGSCPCQPFSSAGAQAGFADERHLWPHFHWLIEQCRPAVVFGEQVASKAAEPWIDLVQADLEALEYAFGCIAFPSAGVGAPHIRDRAYWVGHADEPGPQGHPGHGGAARWQGSSGSAATAGVSGGLADAAGSGQQRRRTGEKGDGRDTPRVKLERLCDAGGMGNAGGQSGEWNSGGFSGEEAAGAGSRSEDGRHDHRHPDAGEVHRHGEPGPTNGFWANADWLLCRDGKWRPVEPGTFPLVDGAPARVVRLRAYGNAINAEAAREFIETVMECIG